MQLKQMYNCAPVFIDQDVRDKYYKGTVAVAQCTEQCVGGGRADLMHTLTCSNGHLRVCLWQKRL